MKKKTIKKKKVSVLKAWLSSLTRVQIFKGIVFFVGSLLLFFVGLFFLAEPDYTDGFRNLTELQQYGKTIDELVESEDENLYTPSYENYYQKKISKTFVQDFTQRFGWFLFYSWLKRVPVFSPSFFQTILNNMTAEREQRGWKGEFVQKITLNERSKVVVFGATQGAYHSLTRDFEQLKKLGILNENLTITNPDYYIIFLGNFVHRSPYSLEFFSIILKLLQNNPTNVIALRGKNEYFYHPKQTLYREIVLRIPSEESSLVIDKVKAFFQTLPLNLYCVLSSSDNQKTVNYFQISPSLIDPDAFGEIINKNKSMITSFIRQSKQKSIENFFLLKGLKNQNNKQKTINDTVNLKAIIKDINKKYEYEAMDGLRLLAWKDEVIVWTVMSVPTESYQKFCNFFYDAFVVIEPARSVSDWTITLYNRDIRSKSKEFQKRSHNFFTGKVCKK